MNLATKEGKSLELKKHVNAIHCSNDLTLVQRKLFNGLLFNAYYELPYKQRFDISTKELCTLIGYNSHDHGKLKKALLGMITTAIEWNIIDCNTGKETQWKASSVLAAAEILNGTCTYEYSQTMREFLYQPDVYAKINIPLISMFKSGYGLALYENCTRYEKLPQTPWFNIDTFRKLMGVTSGKYASFNDFKKRVLNIAVDEVNSISPISIYPEIERENQKVTRIRFKIDGNNKKNNKSPAENTPVIDENLSDVLFNKFSLSKKIIVDLFSKYEQTYISDKVDLIIASESFSSGKIKGLAGYLIDALKNDYQQNKTSKTVVNEHRQKKYIEEKIKKEQEKQAKIQYEIYVNNKISTYLSALSELSYKKVIAAFETYLSKQNNLFLRWYQEKNFEHAAVKALFDQFIINNYSNELGEVHSYDTFARLQINT